MFPHAECKCTVCINKIILFHGISDSLLGCAYHTCSYRIENLVSKNTLMSFRNFRFRNVDLTKWLVQSWGNGNYFYVPTWLDDIPYYLGSANKTKLARLVWF